MADVKPPATYDEQIAKLISRGCVVEDEEKAKDILAQVNYYRLSAYFLPFKRPDETYIEGTKFEKIYQIYEFDRELRNLLFVAIEEIEINLRAQFAYFHGHKYGALGYLDAANYNKWHCHDKFQRLIKTEVKNNRKILFVRHHIDNYGEKFPVWVITELFTFGMLSYFYIDLPTPDQKYLAKELFQTVPKNLASWLRCCTDLRNICAHYGRLYFRIFTAIPADLPDLEERAERRLFGAILALKALHPDAKKWDREIYTRLEKLMSTYSSIVNLDHVGFPADWQSKLTYCNKRVHVTKTSGNT